MLGKRGINLDWANEAARPDPGQLAGFDWVRLIAHPAETRNPQRPSETLADYLEALQATGIGTILVLPGGAFTSIATIVPETEQYARALAPNVWQIGNEPDASWFPGNTTEENSVGVRHQRSEPSWVMSPDDYANLVFNCADIIRARRPDASIITAGFASGFPEFLDQATWDAILGHLDGVAVHPYLKTPEPNWPPDGAISGAPRGFVGDLLDNYAAIRPGLNLWVTEFGTSDSRLHSQYYARMYVTLERRPDLRAACAFCYSAAMNNQGYAVFETPAWAPLLGAPPLPF